MALNMGQLSTLGTVSRFIVQIGGGPGQLLVGAPAGTVYIGSSNVSTTNGVLVPAGGLSIPLFQGSGANQVYAIATGTGAIVNWISSTSSGLGANPGGQ